MFSRVFTLCFKLSLFTENQLDKFLAAARRHGRTEELLEKIHNLILDDSNDEDKEAKWSRMASFVKDQSKQNKAHLSSRKDDPDWFKGLFGIEISFFAKSLILGTTI